MWVPNRYAALLPKENLTSVNVCTQLYVEMHANGVFQLCSTLIDYLRFQILRNAPLNTTLVIGYDLVQPQTDSSFLRNLLSVLKHLVPFSATAPPPALPVVIQGMSAF